MILMATTANSPLSPAQSDDSDGQQPLTVNAWVSFYTKTQVIGKGKKAKTNTTKEVIGKEFTHIFVNDEVNYCNGHWNCLPDLGIGDFMRDQ